MYIEEYEESCEKLTHKHESLSALLQALRKGDVILAKCRCYVYMMVVDNEKFYDAWKDDPEMVDISSTLKQFQS